MSTYSEGSYKAGRVCWRGTLYGDLHLTVESNQVASLVSWRGLSCQQRDYAFRELAALTGG